MAIYVFSVTTPQTFDPDPINSEDPRNSCLRASRMLADAATGEYPGTCSVVADTAAVAASGTVTCATVLATNTCTVGGVTFTAVTGAAGANQFDRSGTDAETAANLAASINASVTAGVTGCVTAAVLSGAVVTITASTPGKIGNAITLASSGATLTVSGARLASGAGTRTTLSF
jgi:phage tail sheath gpL-like